MRLMMKIVPKGERKDWIAGWFWLNMDCSFDLNSTQSTAVLMRHPVPVMMMMMMMLQIFDGNDVIISDKSVTNIFWYSKIWMLYILIFICIIFVIQMYIPMFVHKKLIQMAHTEWLIWGFDYICQVLQTTQSQLGNMVISIVIRVIPKVMQFAPNMVTKMSMSK